MKTYLNIYFDVPIVIFLTILIISKVSMADKNQKNVLGDPIKICSVKPMTGFFRDGFCRTGDSDTGSHVVAAIIDQKFLDYTKSKGNDLETPQPQYNFLGLKPGDRWCVCATRWNEALKAGVAPAIDLEATHEKALKYISIETLKKHKLK